MAALPYRTEFRATTAITAALRAAAYAVLALLALPAYAYHPLATEDTETIGAGRYQFELSLDRARGVERSRGDQVNLILSYGLAEKLDLQFGAPQLRRRRDDGAGGVASARGAGDARADLKWQMLASGGFTLGFSFSIRRPAT